MHRILSQGVPRKYLVDYGLDVLGDNGLLPDKKEYEILKAFMPQIQTDFLGFGNVYGTALNHMRQFQDIKTVVDIGCAWGLFSYLFKGYDYVGLEEFGRDFCKYYDHHRFVKGVFPFQSVDGDVFIASMSLGYGGRFYREMNSSETKSLFLKEISRFKYGYYRGDKKIGKMIADVFSINCISKEDQIYFCSREGVL